LPLGSIHCPAARGSEQRLARHWHPSAQVFLIAPRGRGRNASVLLPHAVVPPPKASWAGLGLGTTSTSLSWVSAEFVSLVLPATTSGIIPVGGFTNQPQTFLPRAGRAGGHPGRRGDAGDARWAPARPEPPTAGKGEAAGEQRFWNRTDVLSDVWASLTCQKDVKLSVFSAKNYGICRT